MCDQDIHPGLVEDWRVSRRAVMAAGLASFAASAAVAEGAVVETDVSVRTPDGQADAALFHPAGTRRWPAVLVWPDIMGLRPAFRDIGRRLAAQGYVVLVPNPFYRSARAPVLPLPIDFGDPATRTRLMGFRAAISDEGIDRDAAAHLAFLDAQPATDRTRKAGVQGYCMAGPFAFRTGAVAPARIGAVATFHGGGLVTDQPDSPHLLIPRTRAAFLVAIARNDDAHQPVAKDTLRAAFAAAGRPATVEVYPADHGWCVPGSQVYDHDAAERAWAGLTQLYKANLV